MISSGSGKTNALLTLINQQDDIGKVYLYAKHLSETKYEFLMKKPEDAGKNVIDSKAYIECSHTMDKVYENNDEYSPTRRKKILIAFNDMIADIIANKKF